MAELVDALGSGSSGGFLVEVRVFSTAPNQLNQGVAIVKIATLFFISATIHNSHILLHPSISARLCRIARNTFSRNPADRTFVGICQRYLYAPIRHKGKQPPYLPKSNSMATVPT